MAPARQSRLQRGYSYLKPFGYLVSLRGFGTDFLIASFHSPSDSGSLPSRSVMELLQASQIAFRVRPRTSISLSKVPNLRPQRSQVIPNTGGSRGTPSSSPIPFPPVD